MLAIDAVRGNPGRAVADTALLVILLGIITIVDFVFSRFMDTRDAASIVAITIAAASGARCAVRTAGAGAAEARDKKLRRLMKRRA